MEKAIPCLEDGEDPGKIEKSVEDLHGKEDTMLGGRSGSIRGLSPNYW